ncbi:MAG: ATP-binding protein [Bacteriovoracaceae bacterium]
MRLYLVLIFTSIITAFVTGYMSLSLKNTHTPSKNEVLEINQIKWQFQQQVAPRAIVNFRSLYHNSERAKLLDPVYTIPNKAIKPGLDYVSDKKCFEDMDNILTSANYEKVWVWEEFRCGLRLKLSNSFFYSAPYLHPSGQSYAALAYKSAHGVYSTRDWVLGHLNLFHVGELAWARSQIGPLEGVFVYLQHLDRSTLEDIVAGKGTILTKDFLLARIKYPGFTELLEYRFYLRDDLEHFLKDSNYILHNYRPGKHCFYRDGEICWDLSMRHVFSLLNSTTLVVFLGCIIILGFLIVLIINKLKAQRLEDERKRLALQVLTHEFRTPVASLLLQVENLSPYFEKLSDPLQEILLRISGDAYRLKRLTDMSRNYIKSQNFKGLFDFNIEVFPSVNDFVEDIVLEYQEGLTPEDREKNPMTLNLLEKDLTFATDWYWLRICVLNLLKNAIDHGLAPITINLTEQKGCLFISVSDSGDCQFETLDEITREFSKGQKSEGTGLGLNIVRKVVESLKGKLLFSQGPTTFTMELPCKEIKNKKENE